MRKKLVESWVVYKMTLHGKVAKINAVCEQSEWDAMEQAAARLPPPGPVRHPR